MLFITFILSGLLLNNGDCKKVSFIYILNFGTANVFFKPANNNVPNFSCIISTHIPVVTFIIKINIIVDKNYIYSSKIIKKIYVSIN